MINTNDILEMIEANTAMKHDLRQAIRQGFGEIHTKIDRVEALNAGQASVNVGVYQIAGTNGGGTVNLLIIGT